MWRFATFLTPLHSVADSVRSQDCANRDQISVLVQHLNRGHHDRAPFGGAALSAVRTKHDAVDGLRLLPTPAFEREYGLDQESVGASTNHGLEDFPR